MTDVIAGKTGKDSLSVLDDNTQVYGLAGNDTLKSNGKNNVLLIGGSGDDRLIMTGGNGTLSGGKGKDVFELNYSAEKKISAVIEDIDPTNDKIVVTFDGSSTPELASVKSGNDVIWTDSDGYFNLTLKGSSDASDYFDGTASSEVWDVLRLTNDERENEGLPWLTLSQGLAAGAAIRSTEIVDKFSHTRPDDTDCFTAVTKSYWSMGENIAAGQTSPEKVVEGWMNSPGHRANILNSDFKKLGVGYTYDASSDYKYHWVQMFGGGLTSPDTLSAEKILSTKMTLQKGSLPEDTATINTVIDADNNIIKHGGTYTIAKNFTGMININTTDAVTIDGTSAGSLKDVQIVTNVANADLTIKNLTVTNETGSTITFGAGTGNKLTLAGKNVLKTSDTWAAVVKIGGGLSIDGTGSLDVTAGSQGSGIGFDSYDCSTANITINGGTIKATTEKGAGIGSGCNGSIGNITINGGTITTTSSKGAGIGSGDGGSIGNITINGGTITTTSGTGAGIGSGMDGSSENISIGGNAKVIATSEFGAGVGKGSNFDGNVSTVGKITFSGKSSVLITQMDQVTGTAYFDRVTEFKVNGKTYTDPQLLFENGTRKNLSEKIIVSESVKTGSDKGDNIWVDNSSWYGAATIDAGKGNDTIYTSGVNMLILAGEGNDSIESMGIGFTKSVAGYITLDAGAGNDTVWVGANMGGVDDYYSSINGGTGNDSIRVNGNYATVTGGDGNDHVGLIGKYSILDGGNGNDTIWVSSNLGETDDKYFSSISGGDGNDSISVNVNYVTVTGGKGNDLIESKNTSSYYIDSDGNFLRWAENDHVTYQYANGDGNDTIEGFDSKNTIQISGGSYSTISSGNDVIIKVGKGSITLKDAAYKTLNIQTIKGGGSTDTTPADTTPADTTTLTVTNSTKSPVTIGSAVKTVDASKRTTAVKITGNALDNSIVGGSKNDSIYGGTGADTLKGNAGNDKLFGEVGNDLLWGGAGNDTITGGDGNDIFIYSAGKDVIADYATGDKISLGAAISKSSVKGSDVIFTIGSGSLTVKNGKGKTLNLIDKSGKESSTILGDLDNSTLMTVTNSTKSPVTIGAAVKTVDASTRTKAVKITGNDLANSIVGGSKNDSIYGGKGNDSILGNAGNDKLYGETGNDKLYGGAGNDSLWGGAGNDSLWGDAGADTFIYSNGDGKDVIFGFDDTDMLEITGAFSTSTNTKGTEIYFKVGSTAKAITLKDFGDTTTFNVNGDTYQLSGKTFVKK